MIAVATILYIALILLVYRVLKVRPTPVNIAAVVVLGVVLIGAIVVLWRFSAPISSHLVVQRYTVALVPQVRGPITKIHAEPNVPLRKGQDVLLEIQRDTYENSVQQLAESLEAAQRDIEQLEAGAMAAAAAVKKSEANLAAAQAELTVATNTIRDDQGAVSKLRIEQLTEKSNAAQAALDEARARAVQARIGKQVAESTAQSLAAQLATARFNLQQCTVYAPADGFVTNWAVREGTMAVPLPVAPLGTFIDTSRVNLAASYPQNLLKHVRPGDPAELTFKTRPGEVFPAIVETIVQATGEGQMPVGSSLPSVADLASEGMLAVKFTLQDDELARQLALGTAGTCTVYTSWGQPFHVISKVTLRIQAWLYYLVPT